MIRRAVFLIAVLVVGACSNGSIYSEYQSLPNGNWTKNQALAFTVHPTDTIAKHNIFIHIRNDDSYAFSNLFLITKMEFPNGNTVVDTLEYEMAKPSGEWLGKGSTATKESKLWYKENVTFPSSGNYTISVAHAMRKNGDVNGVSNLQGVTEVGIQIEKSLN